MHQRDSCSAIVFYNIHPISRYPAFISNRNSGQRLRMCRTVTQGDQSSLKKRNTASGLRGHRRDCLNAIGHRCR